MFGWGEPVPTNSHPLPTTATDCINLTTDEAQNGHQEVYGSGGYDNQAKFSHELIAGGAAFEGMKLYEDHQRKEGRIHCPSLA